MSKEPDVIRHDAPHQITVTEGSQVAASKSLDPNAPQVRKVLAGENSEQAQDPAPPPELPPPLAASAQPAPAAVFERQAGAPRSTLQAPDAAPPAAGEPGIVFERALHDEHAGGPLVPGAPPAQDAELLTRAIEDRFVAVPAQALTAPAADGPVQSRALHDRQVQIDPGLAPPPAAPGPVLAREVAPDALAHAAKAQPLPDNWQKLPPAEGRALAEPVAVPPAEPALPPVPTAQAQAELLETARQVQVQIEETLGAADPQWVEMDFPARVIRLKIENDKVRTRLDQLEAMARQPLR